MRLKALIKYSLKYNFLPIATVITVVMIICRFAIGIQTYDMYDFDNKCVGKFIEYNTSSFFDSVYVLCIISFILGFILWGRIFTAAVNNSLSRKSINITTVLTSGVFSLLLIVYKIVAAVLPKYLTYVDVVSFNYEGTDRCDYRAKYAFMDSQYGLLQESSVVPTLIGIFLLFMLFFFLGAAVKSLMYGKTRVIKMIVIGGFAILAVAGSTTFTAILYPQFFDSVTNDDKLFFVIAAVGVAIFGAITCLCTRYNNAGRLEAD